MFDDAETNSDNPSPFKIKYLQGEDSAENTITEKYSDSESSSGSILSDASRYLTMGKEYATVASAYLGGNTDANSLTNIIFFDRHPERKNKPINPKNEPKEAYEWLKIKNEIVLKTIEQIKKNQYTSPPTVLPVNNSGEFTPAPIGVPVNNPVPFAPKPTW